MKSDFEKIASLKLTDQELVADSYKVIKKIIDFSNFKPKALYFDEKVEAALELKEYFPTCHSLGSEEFKNIPGVKFHKGLIGVFSRDQDKKLTIEDIEAPFVVLNGVTSPENVGSIVRTISGLGFKSIILDNKSASPFLRRAIRVSMGNVVFLKVIDINDIADFIKNSKFPIYATANTSESVDLTQWLPEKESGFIIGSEGHGIDPHLYKLCKNTVRIPIRDEVQHLNAGHSCAIVASRYLFNSSK